ncbi:MAG: diphthine--ammonia ligase [Candidatus Bathyarchaeota archaeon]|jgi:ABC transporter with metal-binding/Fe-S-binding domain ATP-binding protein
MRLAALFSGGKDSAYAAHLASNSGEVTYLVTMNPRRSDSWMFHSVNIHLTPLLAEALDIKHLFIETSGEKECELEDLSDALRHLDVDGLVSGAISSRYQKERIDRICQDLGLKHLTPLWGRSAHKLLEEVVMVGLVTIVTSVAAMGLDKRWLGMLLNSETVRELKELSQRFGFDVCGEGGEMETLVIDAPWFGSRLEVVKARRIWDGIRGSFIVEETRLVPKTRNP